MFFLYLLFKADKWQSRVTWQSETVLEGQKTIFQNSFKYSDTTSIHDPNEYMVQRLSRLSLDRDKDIWVQLSKKRNINQRNTVFTGSWIRARPTRILVISLVACEQCLNMV